MSARRSLSLRLSPSRFLAAALLGLHATAGASVLALLDGVMGAALAAAFVGLGAASGWNRGLLLSRRSVREILIEDAGAASLTLRDGTVLSGRIAPRRCVTRHLVGLAMKGPAGRTLLVTSDMLEPGLFRALRIWALWGKVPGVATKQLVA